MVCKLNFLVFAVVDLFISEAEAGKMALFNYFNHIAKVPSIEKMEAEIEFFEEHGLPLNHLL